MVVPVAFENAVMHTYPKIKLNTPQTETFTRKGKKESAFTQYDWSYVWKAKQINEGIT